MARDDTVAADAARVATLAGGGSVQEAARAAGRSSSSGLAVALRSGGLAARVGKLERLARAHGGDGPGPEA